jgi:hypothetical protein
VRLSMAADPRLTPCLLSRKSWRVGSGGLRHRVRGGGESRMLIPHSAYQLRHRHMRWRVVGRTRSSWACRRVCSSWAAPSGSTVLWHCHCSPLVPITDAHRAPARPTCRTGDAVDEGDCPSTESTATAQQRPCELLRQRKMHRRRWRGEVHDATRLCLEPRGRSSEIPATEAFSHHVARPLLFHTT